MPFKKTSEGKYKSPSGRTFTKKQVALYHAHDGFPSSPAKKRAKRKPRKKAAKK